MVDGLSCKLHIYFAVQGGLSTAAASTAVALRYPDVCGPCLIRPPSPPPPSPPPPSPPPPSPPPPSPPPPSPPPPGLPPFPPPPPYPPVGETCKLVYGAGDCREYNYCSGRGNCTNGMCMCPPEYLDGNCSIAVNCKYWDTNTSTWRTDGLTTVLRPDGSGVDCQTLHLTTFGGLISIPTSADELLAELADAFKFNAFSMDEAFALLSNFNIGDNMTIFIIVMVISCADIFSLLILGWYRGRRGRIRREREGSMYEHEAMVKELNEYNEKLKGAKTQFRITQMDGSGSGHRGSLFGEVSVFRRRKPGNDLSLSRRNEGSVMQADNRWLAAAAKVSAAPKRLVRQATNATLGIRGGQQRLELVPQPPVEEERPLSTPPAPSSPPRLRLDTPTPPRAAGGIVGVSRSAVVAPAPEPRTSIPENGTPPPSPPDSSGTPPPSPPDSSGTPTRMDSPRAPRLEGGGAPAPAAESDDDEDYTLSDRARARKQRNEKLAALRKSRREMADAEAAKKAAENEAAKAAKEAKEAEGEEGEEEEKNLIVLPPNPTALDRVKYMTRRSMVELKGFGERLGPTLRSEHTFINLVAPPDDEEALQQSQVVQLFWNTIGIELFLTCLQAQVEDDSGTPAASDWGGKRVSPSQQSRISETNRLAAMDIEDPNALSVGTFAISPVTALTQGVVSAGGTTIILLFCAYCFAAGNSRQRKGTGIKAQYRYIRRKLLKCRRAAVRFYKRHNFNDDDDDDIPDTPPSEEEEPPEGMTYVTERYLTQIGWVILVAGCFTCPGINLLALYFCKRKRRILMAIEDAPSVEVELHNKKGVLKQAVKSYMDPSEATILAEQSVAEQSMAPKALKMRRSSASVVPADDDEDSGGGALAQSRIQMVSDPPATAPAPPLTATFEAGPLGIDLADRDGAVLVVGVGEGHAAAQQGVRLGTAVQSVNGESVSHLDREGLIALVKETPRPITITFAPPPDAKSPPPSPPSSMSFATSFASSLPPPSPPPSPGALRMIQGRSPTSQNLASPVRGGPPGRPRPGGPPGRPGLKKQKTFSGAPVLSDAEERRAMAAEINAMRTRGEVRGAGQAESMIKLRRLEAQKRRLEGIRAAQRRLVNKGLNVTERKDEKLDFASLVLEAQIKAKQKELKWRGPIEYRVRYILGWLINFLILGLCLLVSLIYAAKFGNNQFTQVAAAWLMAYGWTFLLVEPFQVLFLAGAPCLFNEETRCGRCMIWCRFIYNELCAP